MNQRAKKALLITLWAAAAMTSASAQTMAQRYPGAWASAANIDITKALAKNEIRGCGEFYYRAAAGSTNEFLVYCTRDSKTWTSYLVFTSSQKVMGPYGLDASLPPPGR